MDLDYVEEWWNNVDEKKSSLAVWSVYEISSYIHTYTHSHLNDHVDFYVGMEQVEWTEVERGPTWEAEEEKKINKQNNIQLVQAYKLVGERREKK